MSHRACPRSGFRAAMVASQLWLVASCREHPIDRAHEEGLVYGVALNEVWFGDEGTIDLYEVTLGSSFVQDKPSGFDDQTFEDWEALLNNEDPITRPIGRSVDLVGDFPEVGAALSHVGFDDHFQHAIVLVNASYEDGLFEETLVQLAWRYGRWAPDESYTDFSSVVTSRSRLAAP